MKRLTLFAFLASVSCPALLSAQVNPVNDFFGGLSIVTTGGDAADATRHTLVGWQAAASQKIKSAEKAATRGDTPFSIVGDFGGQFGTADDGRALRAYEYMAGVRVRGGQIRKPVSVFGHAVAGATIRSAGTTSETGFMMGYGGGVDVATPSGPAYGIGLRTQVDWLPSYVNGAWATNRYRLAVGIVIVIRYWD